MSPFTEDPVEWWVDHVVMAPFEWAHGRGVLARLLAMTVGPFWALAMLLVGFPYVACCLVHVFWRSFDD